LEVGQTENDKIYHLQDSQSETLAKRGDEAVMVVGSVDNKGSARA
jgi:hypothetical protein